MKKDSEWILETPQGPAKIRFAEKNSNGILDPFVSAAPGPEIYVPMRVAPNEKGSEILFTLFRMPQMNDESFRRDLAWVTQDLSTLKALPEHKQLGEEKKKNAGN